MKRGWSDLEPKVAFALVSGGAATVILKILVAYGIDVPTDLQPLIPYVCAVLGGYLTPSVGTTIIQPSNDKVITETHSGPVTTTVTGPTPIQKDSGVVAEPGKFDHILGSFPSAKRETFEPTVQYGSTPDAPTQAFGDFSSN